MVRCAYLFSGHSARLHALTGGSQATPSPPAQTYIREEASANMGSIRDKVPFTWENGGC